MKIKQLLMLMLMVGIAFSLSAQDASFYKKYADKGDKEAMYNLADCYFNGTGGVLQDMNQASYWLTKSAKKNYAPAQVKLAYCYIYGAGVLKDYKQAWELAQKAVKQENPDGHYLVASMYKDGVYVPQNWSRWLQYIRSAANLGSSDAQADLGFSYLYGLQEAGISQDAASAIPWLRKASDQNNDRAAFNLGFCYECGVGVPKDEEKALHYYYIAANAGNAQGQYEVAMAYLLGKNGFQVDVNEAKKYLDAAIEQEEPRAYKLQGDMYYYGIGIDEDNEKAAEWYKKSSDAGNLDASASLANMYINGIGVTKNESKGYQLYKLAADAEIPNGLAGLGLCYENGYGVAKIPYQATLWYRKAADLGNSFAQYRLYSMYREGEGVTKNNTDALKYLKMAADNEYNLALHSMAYEYSQGEILHKENSKVLEYLQKAADNGNYYSMGTLGLMYYDGDYIVSKDYDKAFYYLSEAISRPMDFEDSMLGTIYRDLAACYRFGRGTEVNHSMASYYTEQAAKYGDKGSFDAVNALRK